MVKAPVRFAFLSQVLILAEWELSIAITELARGLTRATCTCVDFTKVTTVSPLSQL